MSLRISSLLIDRKIKCHSFCCVREKQHQQHHIARNAGDASSPHGSNCLQFNGNIAGGDGSNSKSSSPSLPAATNTEGLTRQQLDIISQIMQQTKANPGFTSNNATNNQRQIQRPRTWNMQVKFAYTKLIHPHTQSIT